MMQRPPYVPKFHSSQILTRVSGRTYESQTGLFFFFFDQIVSISNEGERWSREPLTIFRHISHKDDRWLNVALRSVFFWFRLDEVDRSPIPGWRLHMIKSIWFRTSDQGPFDSSKVGNAPGWCLDMVVVAVQG